MNKGILFSMDAALALIAVILLVAWLPQQFSAAGGKADSLESLNQQAVDKAMTAFYSGGTASENIGGTAEFGKCVVVYTLNPDNSLATRATPQPQTFCEEIG